MTGSGITEDLLKWNSSLTTHMDRDGSTPIHIASSLSYPSGFKQLFKANPAPVYQADKNGLFPIHVAASVGEIDIVRLIVEKFPSCAGLRTAQGRTFLHVAVENIRLPIVSFVCRTPSLAWILNMQDNGGNTALHLAIQAESFRMFSALYANKEVHLNLVNANKQTTLDISRSLISIGTHTDWNRDGQIYQALRAAGAKHCNLRRDHTEEKYSHKLKPEDEVKEAEKVKDSSQMLGVGSVLIATMAFGATFSVPGGFIADDHTNRGTPTLAGSYIFDAFMMANTLAFICSSMATIGLMFSGVSMLNLKSRQTNFRLSVILMSSSLTSLAASFALGVYMLLAPVSRHTAIAICVLTPLLVLYRNWEIMFNLYILTPALYQRIGPIDTIIWFLGAILSMVSMDIWPLYIIFFCVKLVNNRLEDSD
ncbi:unnamed protein product [Alopecurus aequalis]